MTATNTAQEVAKLRSQVAVLKAQEQALIRSPRSHAETRAEIRLWCERVAAAPTRKLAYAVQMAGHGEPLSDAAFSVRPLPGMPVDASPLIVALLGPAVVADRLGSMLEGTPDGPTSEQRATQQAEFAQKRFALELAEEELIERSEAEGAPIARRADADPRAVLWVAPSNAVPEPGEGEDARTESTAPLYTSTPAEERRTQSRTQPSRYLAARRA